MGRTAPPPTDKIRAQLEAAPTTSESNMLIMSQFKLKVRQKFQMGSSVFRIINISGDKVRPFVSMELLRELLDILMHRMF